MADDSVTYTELKDAIDHLAKENEEVGKRVATFTKDFQGFTGFPPDHRVTAFDVVQIFYKFKDALKDA